MSAIAQALIAAYGAAAAITDAIYMLFDTGNGSTTFTDAGTAGSTWSGTAGVVCSTAHIIEGVSSLYLPSNADYLEAATSSTNRLPASSDFSVKWKARYSSSLSAAGTGGYLISIQDASATAAGTQFAIVTNSSGNLAIVYSDGTTRSVAVGSTPITTGSDIQFEFKRVGTTLTLMQAGVAAVTVTGFSGSFPAASGTKWRLGKPENGSNNALATGSYLDHFTLTR